MRVHRVVVLALEGVYPFELSIPVRVFGSAEGRYQVMTCSVDGRPVRTNADFKISPDHDASAIARADTLIVPPCDLTPFERALPVSVARALKRIRPGTRTMSICTGAFVLAAAGMLDGRPATTHWLQAESFRRRYPTVRLDPNVLFVDDGNVLTSAGAASGVDACLHLVRKDFGSDVANAVARKCVVPPWRDGGQAQYIERPTPKLPEYSTAATQAWILKHLGRPLVIAELAAHSRMSERTFARRFQDEVGTSPGRWMLRQRVEAARALLETSDLSIERIAEAVGFSSASQRQHLRASLGVSPSAYRRAFRRAS